VQSLRNEGTGPVRYRAASAGDGGGVGAADRARHRLPSLRSRCGVAPRSSGAISTSTQGRTYVSIHAAAARSLQKVITSHRFSGRLLRPKTLSGGGVEIKQNAQKTLIIRTLGVVLKPPNPVQSRLRPDLRDAPNTKKPPPPFLRTRASRRAYGRASRREGPRSQVSCKLIMWRRSRLARPHRRT
jgi:hypothetical protein